MMQTKPIRDGFHAITPYLFAAGAPPLQAAFPPFPS
jgi:hypothetical protein